MAWSDNWEKAKPAGKQSPRVRRGLIAGGVMALAACVGLFFVLSGGKEEAPAEKVVGKPKAAKAARPAAAKPAFRPAPEKKAAPEPAQPKERKIDFRSMTPEQRLDWQIKRAAERPLPAEPATNRAFRTGAEQLLSWVFMTELGDMPPPLPQVSLYDEVHLEEILNSPNPVREGDSERTKDAKQTVELAKKELKAYIEKGGDISSFLEYYRGVLVQAAEEHSHARREVMRICREEPDIAEDYIRATNKILAEKGIKPVRIPPRLRERLGLPQSEDSKETR